MAIKKCKECKKEVSSKAKTCPHCGIANPGIEKSSLAGGCLVLIIISIFIGYLISSNDMQSTSTDSHPAQAISKPKQKQVAAQVFVENPKLKSKSAFRDDSHNICTKNWTKRGKIDREMYNHCMKGQMDGYKDLKHLHKYSDQSFYSRTAYPYCLESWTKRGISDAQMMAHCLNQEVEGMKDVMYYRDKYELNKVNEIVEKAIRDFDSWNMAAYKVKQYFEE